MNDKRVKWSASDETFLSENWAIHGSSYCAEHLNKTIEAVSNKAARLGLKRNMFKRYNKPENIPNGYQYCFKCKQNLPESDFYLKAKNGRYGTKAVLCRSCSRESARRSYRKHSSNSVARYQLNPAKKILQNLKTRAKKQNLPFDLTEEDIIIPKICPILGIPIILFSKSDNSPSVDRFIPSKGYVRGNINIISNRANRIKTDATLTEIELVYLWMKEQSK
jgi:uncharacterized CHY-type Zn-finger protein